MLSLEKQEYTLKSSSLYSREFPNFSNNEAFLLLMDEINITVSNLVKNKKHRTILNIFVYYLDTELYLLKLINRLKNKKMHNYNLKKYRELLELQNYYNNFRILLISQIAEHLTRIFNQLQKLAESDLLKSIMFFKYHEKVLNFYIDNLKFKVNSEYKKEPKLNSDKIIQYKKVLKIFVELKQLFNTVPNSKKSMFALLTI